MSELGDFTLLSDEPIRPNRESGDALGFERVAQSLAETILGSHGSTPFTLGIEGWWGAGKSSLMRHLDDALRKDDRVSTVWFNAWLAEDASVLEGLIKTALDKLDRNVLRKALRNQKLIRMASSASLALLSWVGGLGLIDPKLRGIIDATWDRLSVDARGRNELRDLVHHAIGEWRKKRQPHGDRLLVMFIDDLDRAAPNQVFEVFETIKLYLDTPGFVFVIGYDDLVISEAVLKHQQYSESVKPADYLEKIVQVIYRIPAPDDDQATNLFDHLTKASRTESLFNHAATTTQLVIDRNHRNPRRIKRFLNRFVLQFALDPDWQALGAERLVEVLLLDTHFPEFMSHFRAGTDADPISEFLNYRDERSQVLNAPTDKESTERFREREKTLPKSYPALVENPEFVDLVASLRRAPQWTDLRLKLQRRSHTLTTAVPSESREDEQWYHRAANQGDIDAIYNLARMLHERGDLDEAQQWYVRAAHLGHLEAMHDLGLLLLQLGRNEETELWWRHAAEAGHTDATYNLGTLYSERGDLPKAEHWLRRSAEAGDARAMTNLGHLFDQRRDLDEAEVWYRSAAAVADAQAMYNLGVMLVGPRGDTHEAEQWFRRAIDLDNTNAMVALGALLADRGGDDNVAEAEQWYRRAADEGHADAIYNLGVLLADRGDNEAEQWYREAAETGDTRAMLALAELLEQQGRADQAQIWRDRATEESQ